MQKSSNHTLLNIRIEQTKLIMYCINTECAQLTFLFEQQLQPTLRKAHS